jgi:cyclophilin family peptidyl-prolyl cis-trans isomerase/protein-disulfide isomerase
MNVFMRSNFLQPFRQRSDAGRRRNRGHDSLHTALIAVILIVLFASACSNLAGSTSTATASRTPVRLGPTSTATSANPAANQTSTAQTATATLYPLQPVTGTDWSRGSLDAAVTLVVFMDFQSPECVWLETILSQLLEWHPNDLRIVFRHFPQLYLHDKAALAAEAAQAAGAQGAFWEMYDMLYQNYSEWIELTPEAFIIWLKEAAVKIGLNQSQFTRAIDNGEYAEEIVNIYLEAAAAGIPGVPFLYFNELWYRLPITLDNLEASIRLELLKFMQYESYPPFSLDVQGDYIAYVEIPQGTIVIQLYPQYAPLAVNSFVFLSEQGWFDENPIYQVEQGEWVESGDPTGTGWGGPGYVFENEIDPSLNFATAGMLALRSEGPGTNGSIFFITLAPQPAFNGSHTIFGHVIDGLDLLQDLENRSALEDLLSEPEAVIHSITIEGP